MVTNLQIQPISFEEFLEWYPENEKTYELIEGVIVEMLPTGSHEDISGFLIAELNLEIRKQNLPYSIPKNCLIKPLAPRSGYLPDVAVINREHLKNEPLWEKLSVIQNSQTVPLVIEVVSMNWRDDYGHKFVEYEAMGIIEYWIVDYRGVGAVRHIGKPKQPTITICQLIEGEYQMEKYVKGDRLKSSIFPELELTTDTIFQVAQLK
ncbi:unknown [Crocosphaera subtropica ATCC 51142]|uniref:Putative restriction endonuclease domain-containing protein n=1 Tax=Crocosphaera subtropica (strain ATCC 51142 / BH68) TaxID=43989 RepID=B1WY66_CROS5|nr:Uma2 family endonuclease [Crocosphaera subtropica]ACB52650.1 unknown [Crocosphaera subtropica ATCC 51142]